MIDNVIGEVLHGGRGLKSGIEPSDNLFTVSLKNLGRYWVKTNN